ncbi:DUF3793 family protein [Trichloromonas sp.]|uniref:DUF3793 family protein n=1 Tax=Trichloromonas sp. TaxID=3069249 RepID=UPI003D81450E
MPTLSKNNPQSITPNRLWQAVSDRFPEQRDCLASFLAFECAEVLAGVKPGNLINIVNRCKPCGRNLYKLWQRFGLDIMAQTPLSVEILADRGHSLLVYTYRPELLANTLGSPAAQNFLTRAGYPLAPGPEEALVELGNRLKQQDFPHEIGLFLGYPIKDVEGFLGWSDQPFTCQGPWKIYGDPKPSLHLADRHRSCRNRMIHRLARTDDPMLCMVAPPASVRRPREGKKHPGAQSSHRNDAFSAA